MPAASSSTAASAAAEGRSNRVRTASSAPSTVRTRLTRRVASSEWPPSAKKSSPVPPPPPEHVGEQAAQHSSNGVRAARATPDTTTGSGNARRSNFPFTVNGITPTATNTDGTICTGTLNPTNRRNSSPSTTAPGSGTKYATNCALPATSRTTTATCATPT